MGGGQGGVKKTSIRAAVWTAVSSLLLLFWEYGTWSVCGAVVKIGVEVAIAVEVVSE